MGYVFLLLFAAIRIGLLAGIYPALVLSSFKPVLRSPAGCGGESNELKEPTCLKAKSKMNKDSKRKFL